MAPGAEGPGVGGAGDELALPRRGAPRRRGGPETLRGSRRLVLGEEPPGPRLPAACGQGSGCTVNSCFIGCCGFVSLTFTALTLEKNKPTQP